MNKIFNWINESDWFWPIFIIFGFPIFGGLIIAIYFPGMIIISKNFFKNWTTATFIFFIILAIPGGIAIFDKIIKLKENKNNDKKN